MVAGRARHAGTAKQGRHCRTWQAGRAEQGKAGRQASRQAGRQGVARQMGMAG
jgi:hypothetical protein